MNMKKIAFIIVPLTLMLLLGAIYVTRDNNNRSAIANLEKQARDTQTEKTQAETRSETIKRTAQENVTGINYTRINHDNEMMRPIFSKILTWKNENEYRTVRQYAIDTYGDAMTDVTRKQFYIESTPDVLVNGQYKQEYGEDLNLEFLDFEPHIYSIEDDVYNYFAIIKLSSKHSSGYTADGYCMAEYSIDKDYNITKLKLEVLNNADY